jgi:pilus assembly protein Flp/PilA
MPKPTFPSIPETKRTAQVARPRDAVRHDLEGDVLMSMWLSRLKAFLENEDGPTAVEYAVMLALIVVVCITAITTLGNNANNTFSNVALNAAVSSSAS